MKVEKTRDVSDVRNWLEEHEGTPAHIDDQPRRLAVDFGERKDVETISWKKFLDIFRTENLVMVYEEFNSKDDGRSPREKYEFMHDVRTGSAEIPDTEIDDDYVKQNMKETAV